MVEYERFKLTEDDGKNHLSFINRRNKNDKC